MQLCDVISKCALYKATLVEDSSYSLAKGSLLKINIELPYTYIHAYIIFSTSIRTSAYGLLIKTGTYWSVLHTGFSFTIFVVFGDIAYLSSFMFAYLLNNLYLPIYHALQYFK